MKKGTFVTAVGLLVVGLGFAALSPSPVKAQGAGKDGYPWPDGRVAATLTPDPLQSSCDDPESGRQDMADAAGLDISQGLIWAIRGEGERPYAERPDVVLLAQGVSRALCFLR